MKKMLTSILACVLANGVQAGIADNFEAGFSPDWAVTASSTIVNSPGNGAGGSDQYAEINGGTPGAFGLGGYLGATSGTQSFADWSLTFEMQYAVVKTYDFDRWPRCSQIYILPNLISDFFSDLII